MDKNVSIKKAERIAFVAIFLHLIFAGLIFLLYSWVKLETVYTLGWFFLGGVLVWFISALHMRQKRLAIEEELAENIPGEDENRLFEGEALDPFSARTQLKNFEKWVVPIFSFIIAIGFLAGCVSLFQQSYEYYPIYKEFLELEKQKVIADDYELQHQHESVQNNILMYTPISAAFLVGFAFFCFLISKYAIGMAQERRWRYLRAGGSYLFLCAVLGFLAAGSCISVRLEIFTFERYWCFAVPFLFGLLSLEILLSLLLDIYRPRLQDQEVRFPYDSRILELGTGSKGLVSTAAHALDYQFGFKVSETWFYQFLEKAIAPLILFQLLALYAFNCLVMVGPQEQAIIERFGRPVENKVFSSGLHFKLPWPIERAFIHPINQLHEFNIGMSLDEQKQSSNLKDPKSYNYIFSSEHQHKGGFFLISHEVEQQEAEFLFQRSIPDDSVDADWMLDELQEHYINRGKEFPLRNQITIKETKKNTWQINLNKVQHIVNREKNLVIFLQEKEQIIPVNLLMVHVLVRYRINNIMDYVYNHKNPKDMVESIGYRECTRYFARADLNNILGGKRLQTSQDLKSLIQEKCDQSKVGVEISFIGLLEVHPPVPVVEVFEQVIASIEEKKGRIIAGKTHQEKLENLVVGEREAILNQTSSYVYERIQLTEAEAEMFRDILTAYKIGGEIFISRKYLKVLEKYIEKRRLYVTNISNLSQQTDIINLEDQLTTDLLQIDFSNEEE